MSTPHTPDTFRRQIAELTAAIGARSLDKDLEAWLNECHGQETRTFQHLQEACQAGVEQGWLCNREGGGIKYGRIFKPADDLAGFSVDVVDMDSIAGPHHVHPTGEIDLVMPIDVEASFDGRGAGWLVYPPGSAHPPTVAGGRALVLYLLPQGEIKFS